MVDDRQRAGRADRPALDALAGAVARLLISALGDGDALQPDIEAGAVHHREHAFDAAILLADQPADGAAIVAKGEDAGRAGMDAELVLEADGTDVVARAQAAVRVDEEFPHQEERDAPGAGRRVGE